MTVALTGTEFGLQAQGLNFMKKALSRALFSHLALSLFIPKKVQLNR